VRKLVEVAQVLDIVGDLLLGVEQVTVAHDDHPLVHVFDVGGCPLLVLDDHSRDATLRMAANKNDIGPLRGEGQLVLDEELDVAQARGE